MKLRLLLSACLLLGAIALPVSAQDKAKATASKDSAKTLETLKAKQNDSKELNKYFSKEFSGIFGLIRSKKANEAEEALARVEAVVKGLSPENAASKQMVARAKNTIPFFRSQVELARTTVEELKKKLAAKPDDVKSLMMLVNKQSADLSDLARSKPNEAQKQIDALKTYINGLADKVDDDKKKANIKASARSLARIESSIASAKKLLELVGKPAMDLKPSAWVNGSPLTAADMKGKVVLLDFWAIWCGPCIATFPHLREWQEKYDEKDFAIVGLTRYYKYTWDDKAGRAVRSKEEVTHEQEHEMLLKFAEHHKLHHRFALQTDSNASKFYGVSGIPHVVVIDKEGVVRMIRVGSGEKNAKDIGDLLEKLING